MRRSLSLLDALATVAVLLLSVNRAAPVAAAPGTWLARINGFRAQNGLGPLTEDVTLNTVAQGWSQTMAATSTLAHNPLLAQQVTLSWSRLAENIPGARELGGTPMTSPVLAMAVTPSGRGYWLAKGDGTVASFGDAPRV